MNHWSLPVFLMALAGCGQSFGDDTVPPPMRTGGDTASHLVDPVTVLHVKDGDTVDVDFHGTTERVRFKGIDTPELSTNPPEPFAEDARLFVLTHIGTQVDLIFDQNTCDAPPECRDLYDRLLAYIRTADGGDLAARLLAKGLARVYVFQGESFDRKAEYLVIEEEARSAGLGIWSQ